MNGIVQQYPDPALQQKYQVAADTFRLPYWDSAQLRLRNGQKTLAVPILVTQPTVSVLTPTGTQTIPNPLYRYVFKPSPAGLTSIQDNGNLYPVIDHISLLWLLWLTSSSLILFMEPREDLLHSQLNHQILFSPKLGTQVWRITMILLMYYII